MIRSPLAMRFRVAFARVLRFGIAARLVAMVAASVMAAGCQTIAGIDDHGFQTAIVSPQCAQYCDTVMQACTGPNAIYSTRETCLGVCSQLDGGMPIESISDNTVACRQRQADFAKTTTEPNSYCPSAGPGGAGTCGTDCAAYCTLMSGICPAEFSAFRGECEKPCGTLRNRGDFDVVTDSTGDTIGCRLYHVSAATVDPVTHCTHAQFLPTSPCVDPDPVDCKDTCRLNALACAQENAVYESPAQCLAVCAALPSGTSADRDQNTMSCRRWHTYNAVLDPITHCAHTGPGGDGHCGIDETDRTGNCVSYCMLLDKACGGAGMPVPDLAACERDCSNHPDEFGAKHDSRYVIASAQTGPTLQCRLLHLSRALEHPENAATECVNAIGQGACQ